MASATKVINEDREVGVDHYNKILTGDSKERPVILYINGCGIEGVLERQQLSISRISMLTARWVTVVCLLCGAPLIIIIIIIIVTRQH